MKVEMLPGQIIMRMGLSDRTRRVCRLVRTRLRMEESSIDQIKGTFALSTDRSRSCSLKYLKYLYKCFFSRYFKLQSINKIHRTESCLKDAKFSLGLLALYADTQMQTVLPS
jgi:hypothetical protein